MCEPLGEHGITKVSPGFTEGELPRKLPFDSTTKTPSFQLLWRTSPKRVDKTCLVPIMGFVLKKVGPYWIFLDEIFPMAFEDEILFPPFEEEGEGDPGEESDPLEDDELEGDEVKEPDDDEDSDDDFGIEEEK